MMVFSVTTECWQAAARGCAALPRHKTVLAQVGSRSHAVCLLWVLATPSVAMAAARRTQFPPWSNQAESWPRLTIVANRGDEWVSELWHVCELSTRSEGAKCTV